MGYASSKPNSNDMPKKKHPWLDTTELADAFFLIVSGKAKKCRGCGNPTSLRYLKNGRCPDCRDESK